MGKITSAIMKGLIDRITKRYGKDLPPPEYDEGDVREYLVKMRDGTGLKTFVHFPSRDGLFPILFIRTPYVYEFDYFHHVFKSFIKYGFILCYQHCRGRGESEGVFEPFLNERNDGIDTLAWLKSNAWYTGKIVPIGMSYLAMNHLLYCDHWDADFKTAILSMYGGNLYGLVYENGMLRDEFFTVWALSNNPSQAVDGDNGLDIFKRLSDVYPRTGFMEEAAGERYGFYDKIINNQSFTAPVWHNEYFMPDTSCIKTPLCLLTGWYDFTVREVMDMFEKLEPETKSKSAILIGPWNHNLINGGDVKTPRHSVAGIMGYKHALKWLLSFFHNADDGTKTGAEYYVLNADKFESSESLPKYTVLQYYLSAGAQGFELNTDKPRRVNRINYIYDPDDPVYTCGGGSLFPSIKQIPRRYAQCAAFLPDAVRDDVLVFMSEPLEQDAVVLGGRVLLCVSSSAEDTCFTVKLCADEGKKLCAFSYGITNIVNNKGMDISYAAGQRRLLEIKLSPVAFAVKAGGRIALTVSSSDYPSFHRHLNSGQKWCDADTPHKARQSVYTGASKLEIFLKTDSQENDAQSPVNSVKHGDI